MPDMIVLPKILCVYTLGSKLDSDVGIGVYFGKLDLNISISQTDYCSVFQAVVGLVHYFWNLFNQLWNTTHLA